MSKIITKPRALLALGLLILFFHVFRIDSLPMGLYLDETSIGINAAAIAQTGADEHGIRWPTYFKAFGENKNPIYVYAAALLFKLFGVSELNLRLTSAIFFLLSAATFFFTLNLLFRGRRDLVFFGMISFGFLPYFFTVSRISFEVISYLLWTTAIVLTSAFLLKRKMSYQMFFLLGAIIGTSIYTYSTARLLSAVSICILVLCMMEYGKGEKYSYLAISTKSLASLAIMLLAFILALTPYLKFTFDNPGALTGRFLAISYLDDPIPAHQKAALFVKNYFQYWMPQFLLFRGEGNLRHSIGYAGAIYLTTYFLGLIALFSWIKNGSFAKDRFIRFVILSWATAPIAAAMINEQHVLRTMTSGVYWVIASIYGFSALKRVTKIEHRKLLSSLVFSVLALEVILYVAAYFTVFPERSLHGSESYGVSQAYKAAIEQNPKKIWFFAEPHDSYPNIRFAALTIKNETDIPLEVISNSNFAADADECVIYHHWSERRIKIQHPIKLKLSETLKPNYLQRILNVAPKEHVTRMICF
jgi:hypothetical protein